MQPNPRLQELVDPRLVVGLGLEVQNPLPLTDDSILSEYHAVLTGIETDNNRMGKDFFRKAEVPKLFKETVVIPGVDGNDLSLYITRPETLANDETAPCVLYIHGGGMGIYSAQGPMYLNISNDFADTLRCTVVAVEFRNSTGELGNHPFPAGLHDCRSALEWINAEKCIRNFSHVIICGESGGANLSIALTLLMKSENKHGCIDGVYVMCPYISGLYDEKECEEAKLLPSLRACDHCGIVDLKILNAMARVYDPDGLNSRNPLTWPYWATVEDLQGFPPFAVAVNEVDPLCDEGVAFYRKLVKAGVSARCRNILGTPHAGDLICMNVLPDLYWSTLYDIKAFVSALAKN
mmetsp:Transcript_119628/g.235168  ORF Transcript_119628/g.235168 Transcript_119628/m.235168 type:complete len:350 (-) Transcript_119628:513-1562(-)|eukprot:CAMPEP_0170364194 /NCGR_PEP_ID=MMETSP0117_2-20130122/5246_1 /TAXON_ID=400756 /ORGANISM="Durinskia baltica, Strain CSIRO CS-38" /LENGTH=349 /DNA_ID=CAMNT_0010618683 /DNA_START=213 /DNA_END=1262 /DNA_ORIENTATION=-